MLLSMAKYPSQNITYLQQGQDNAAIWTWKPFFSPWDSGIPKDMQYSGILDSHGIWSYAFMGYQFYSTLEKVLERTAFVCGFLFVCMFVCSVLVLDITTQVKSIETYFSKCTNFMYISFKKFRIKKYICWEQAENLAFLYHRWIINSNITDFKLHTVLPTQRTLPSLLQLNGTMWLSFI